MVKERKRHRQKQRDRDTERYTQRKITGREERNKRERWREVGRKWIHTQTYRIREFWQKRRKIGARQKEGRWVTGEKRKKRCRKGQSKHLRTRVP